MTRINFNVDHGLKSRFDSIPWGIRSGAMRVLTEMLCTIHERHGAVGVGAILEREFRLVSDRIKEDVQSLHDHEEAIVDE